MLLLCAGREMPEQTIIAWDVETIPDLPTAARMLGLGMATETEVREALGPSFPKHPLHKIVCIGALVASRQPEGWRMDALGAPLSSSVRRNTKASRLPLTDGSRSRRPAGWAPAPA